MGSRYLVEQEGLVKFIPIVNFRPGDIVILIDTTDSNLNFVRKTVATNVEHKKVFSGWFISVDNAMLFLTKNPDSTSNQSYVTIEHNTINCPQWACPPCTTTCASCPKSFNFGYCQNTVCGPAC
jgi:hypothetical protein